MQSGFLQTPKKPQTPKPQALPGDSVISKTCRTVFSMRWSVISEHCCVIHLNIQSSCMNLYRRYPNQSDLSIYSTFLSIWFIHLNAPSGPYYLLHISLPHSWLAEMCLSIDTLIFTCRSQFDKSNYPFTFLFTAIFTDMSVWKPKL